MHFIGTFTTTDNIVIGDPYAGKVVAEYLSLSKYNLKHIEIDSHVSTWYAYHFYGNHQHPVALILFEEFYHFNEDIHTTQISHLIERGKIVSSFGQMVSAVDRQVIRNTMFTYINTTENLIYRTKDVRKWLDGTKVPNEDQIRKILDSSEKNGEKFIENSILLPLCNTKRIPVESDIWANDCYFRLKDNPINAAIILSGVISKTYTDENTIYTDSDNDCRVIYIDLDENASKALSFRIIK